MTHFNQPSAVLVAPNGDIFVADGHGGASNARIVNCMSLLTAGGFAMQSSRVTERAATVPRTPDGRPDFQGVWSFAVLTPLERPARFAGRATFSEQEAGAVRRIVDQRVGNRHGEEFATELNPR